MIGRKLQTLAGPVQNVGLAERDDLVRERDAAGQPNDCCPLGRGPDRRMLDAVLNHAVHGIGAHLRESGQQEDDTQLHVEPLAQKCQSREQASIIVLPRTRIAHEKYFLDALAGESLYIEPDN